jgi:hypothetical protein
VGTATRAAASFAAGAAAVSALAACATSTPALPRAHSAAERQWIDNASRFIGTLDSDVLLSASGGANLASARRALSDQSDLYTMLVAYTLFGGCSPALANVGTPSARVGRVVETLSSACLRLEHASALFEQAVKRNDPHALLVATRIVLNTEPLLYKAKAELSAL